MNRLRNNLMVPAVAVVFLQLSTVCAAEEASTNRVPIPVGRQFDAVDSIGDPKDDSADAVECLAGLCWKPGHFKVECVPTTTDGVTATIRFPSAIDSGNAYSDRVAMDWYAVHDENGLKSAPAVVVVHESGSGMNVGRMVARGLRDRGMHAFMIHLPYYGLRRPAGKKAEHQDFAVTMRQGIADVRRARDVVAVLPTVDPEQICLQGTSLGGFVSSTTAGIDTVWNKVFILLAGGELPSLVINGKREAGQLREELIKQGYEGDAMFELLNRFEPNRLAHRIPAERLWLYTAQYDTVVPPRHGHSFATAAGLSEEHHIMMPANHYSGIIFLPVVLDQIAAQVVEQ
jgi:dienelactone hydrolase